MDVIATAASLGTGPTISDAMIHRVMDDMPVGCACFDLDLRYTYVNRVLAETNGAPCEAHIGRHVSEILPALLPMVEAATARIRATGDPVLGRVVSGETPKAPGVIRHWRDYWYPLRAGGDAITGYWVVAEEITDRVRAEQALRESERLYRAIGESINYGIWVCDAEGRNRYASESLLKLVGLTREQFERDGWIRALHPDDLAPTMAAWNECVRAGTPWYRELRFRGVDGAYHPVLACGSPVRDEKGEATAWAGINLDIGPLKRVQEELAEAKAALEQAAAAKDQFIARLSHELRTPLTPVVALVSGMVHDGRLPDDVREDLRLIERNISLQVHLINDLLDLTRIVHGRMELSRQRLDLLEVLRESIGIVAADLDQKGQAIALEATCPQCPVEADRTRLCQLFWNLLKNAIKFSPHGARISLAVQASGGRARVSVTDAGEEIEPADLPRLFRAFEQAGAAGRMGGLGLGLAISKGIADLHGGSLHVASEGKGKGATFTVELPLAERVEPALPPEPGPQPRAHSTLRILLVEDHADSARVLQRLLRAEGHEVTRAETAAEALAAARSADFDLVISDIGLPDGNGYDLMRRLSAAGCQAKAIAMSGYGSEEDVRQSESAGFVAHITKPLTMDALTTAVERAAATAAIPEPGRACGRLQASG